MSPLPRLLLLPLLLLGSGLFAEGPVRAGTIDLGAWTGGDPVSLSGSWSLEWGGDPPGSLRTAPVPSRVSAATGSDRGWGSYRLKLLLPPDIGSRLEGGLALYLPPVNTSCRVFWNGSLIWAQGLVSADPEAARPGRLAAVLPLAARAGSNELEIAFANYKDSIGGLPAAPSLGSFRDLLDRRASDRLVSVLLFGSLLVMGLYNLGLFVFKSDDRASLWFALLCFLLGLRQIGLDDSLLFSSFPSLGWEAEMKVSYFTFSASVLCFALFLFSLFRDSTPRWFRPAVAVGAGAYSLAVLLLPAEIYTSALVAFQIYAAGIGLVSALVIGRALRAKSPGAGLFLAGFIPLFASALHDIARTNLSLSTPALSPAGFLFFILFQSLTLMRKFTGALRLAEEHGRYMQRMNLALERFIPREVLSFLGKGSIMEVELGDHSERRMTVLFADIRDFTSLSETLTPDENFRFINSYLERMGPVIRRHGGFVDKYLGDGIMALFPGAPSEAVEAALEIRAALRLYNADRAKLGYKPLRIGVGLHWGPLMLGTIGENRRMDSTVISDAVNTASRLEGLTKKYLRDILLSGETVEAIGAAPEGAARYEFERLGEELVKGKTRPVVVYTLVDEEGRADPS